MARSALHLGAVPLDGGDGPRVLLVETPFESDSNGRR